MTLKIQDSDEPINIFKLKKLNNDIKNKDMFKLSQNNSKKTLLKNKEKLKSLIVDTKNYFKNMNLLKNKTKIKFLKTNPNELEDDKVSKKERKRLYLNTKNIKYNLTKIGKECGKKQDINIITNDINNYYNDINTEDISRGKEEENEIYDDNSLENQYNIYSKIYNDKNQNCSEVHKDKHNSHDKPDEKPNNLKKNIYNLNISNTNSKLKLNEIKKKCKQYLLSYNYKLTQYNIKVINDILIQQNKHIVCLFKNYLLWDDPSEYLKRYYFIYESQFRLRPISSYYSTYTYFSPVYFCNLEIIKILLKNVKRKINYFKELENFDNNFNDENENNTISGCFEDNSENDIKYISKNEDKKNNNNEFIPLIDSYEINRETQISSIKKKSLSLSLTLKNCYYMIESNKKDQINILNMYENSKNNFDCNQNSLFNITITPIKKVYDIVNEFNNFRNINKNNLYRNEKINKKLNINEKYINIKNDENEFDNYELKSKNKNCEKYNKNKEQGKKININLNKNKLEEIQKNLKDKKLKSYNTINEININQNTIRHKKGIILDKKQINEKEEEKEISYKKLKFINNHINNFISNIKFNNLENKLLDIFHKKNILKKIQRNTDPKIINSNNCLTQRNKNLKENNKIYNIINKEYSLILQNKNVHLNNTISNRNSKIKIKKNFHNIILNLNNKYSKLYQFPRLLTLYDRSNNFSSKNNVEFLFGFHSLSSNKKRILKVPDNLNSKSNLRNNINININLNQRKNNENLLLKKILQTKKNMSKKHKKEKSAIYSYKKRNNLTLNSKIQNNLNKNILFDLKKSFIIDNTKKICPISLKNKNYIKNIIDNFRNSNKDNFNLKNKYSANKTFKIIKKSVNLNKLAVNKVKRKCKSKSPTITNIKRKKLIINKAKINLNFLKSIFTFSNNKLLNETNSTIINTINNINHSNEIDIQNKEFGNKKIKRFKKSVNEIDNVTFNYNEYIKSIHPRISSINNIDLSLNLNSQRYICKNENYFNIINKDIFNNKNKYIIKNDYINSSKILNLDEKKKINSNSKSKEKIKLKIKKNTNNKNIGKLSKINTNITKNHYKKFSTQIINDKNIINKNIIGKNLNKRKSLNHKNFMFTTNVSGNQSKNILIKNFKNNYNSVINDDYSDYLTERKYINKDTNFTNTNSNNNLNSFSKDKTIKKNSYMIYPNRNICSLKNKILMAKYLIDKTQNKQNIEDKINSSIRIYKDGVLQNCLHKKSMTNISSFFKDNFKKNSNEYLNRNICKNSNRNNNTSNENSIKKYTKSNYNEFILNHPTKFNY